MTYVTEGTITAIGILFPCLAVICFAVRMQSQRRYAQGIEIDGMLAIPAGVSGVFKPEALQHISTDTDQHPKLLTIGAGIAVTVG